MDISPIITANLRSCAEVFLIIQPSGAKWWRYRYRFNDTTKMLSMGVYPNVKLKEARNEHADFKELLAQDIDPPQHRKEKIQSNSG